MATNDNTPHLEVLRRDVDAACHDVAALQAELEAVMAVAHRLEARLARLSLSLKLRKGSVRPAVAVLTA